MPASSDAIFGFSVTLLVTTLEVPPAAAWQSLSSLLDTGLGDQLLAFVISYAMFKRRVGGVYFAIITQALAFAAWLVFNRNETRLGGTNGLRMLGTTGGMVSPNSSRL